MGGIDCVHVTVCGVHCVKLCWVLQCTGIRGRNKITVEWGWQRRIIYMKAQRNFAARIGLWRDCKYGVLR
jgi:hypothetical protein